MNKKTVIIKILLSLVILVISAIAILYVWLPLLITYIPIDQAYDVTPKEAEIASSIVMKRNNYYESVIKVSTFLVIINLVMTIAIIWIMKFNDNKNI